MPPFAPGSDEPTNDSESYLDFLKYYLSLDSIPQILSTSYGDDEQTSTLNMFTSNSV